MHVFFTHEIMTLDYKGMFQYPFQVSIKKKKNTFEIECGNHPGKHPKGIDPTYGFVIYATSLIISHVIKLIDNITISYG